MKYRKPAAVVFSLLALALLALPGSVPGATEPDRWLEVRTTHFVVVSNAGEERARGVSRQFERARALLGSVLRNAPVDPRDPIVVLAVNSERRLRELLPEARAVGGNGGGCRRSVRQLPEGSSTRC